MLRPQKPSDYQQWYEGFAQRLPAVRPHDMGWQDMTECTPRWFENLCKHHQKLAIADKTYVFGIFSKQDRRHLGNVDLSTLHREQHQWAVLGYGIHNHSWRQGFGKAAVRAGLIAGFEHLKYQRIEAHINLDNEASIALAKSAGMQEECLRRRFVYERGEWTDRFVYVATPAALGVAEKVPGSQPICLRS